MPSLKGVLIHIKERVESVWRILGYHSDQWATAWSHDNNAENNYRMDPCYETGLSVGINSGTISSSRKID